MKHFVNKRIVHNKRSDILTMYSTFTGTIQHHIEQFYKQSTDLFDEWNPAMNRMPHVSLCNFFTARHSQVAILHEALQRVMEKFENKVFRQLELEHFISTKFIGLFVKDDDALLLRDIVSSFASEVALSGVLVTPRNEDPKKKTLHVTLAYQFPDYHLQTLEHLCRSINVAEGSAWDIRLYSRDTCFNKWNVYKVMHGYDPVHEDELELTEGDYVYLYDHMLQESEDGWVYAISWKTGMKGMVPGNFLEKVPETDIWTLHRCFPFARVAEVAVNGITAGETSPFTAKIENRPRQLFVLRHGERVDFTFGGDWWISACFNSQGVYSRVDSNLPVKLPKRKNGPKDYERDAPLTEIGITQARLTGESMRVHGNTVEFMYSSPSYRCVQTGDAVLKALGLQGSIKIRIEPGLFEWMGWYKSHRPKYLSPQELIDYGYNIDADYTPLIREDELSTKESLKDYYARSYRVTKHAVDQTRLQGGGNVMLVAHAASLEMNTRTMLGKPTRDYSSLSRIMNSTPYCSMAAIEETAANKWQLVEPPCMPITHMSNPEFDWTVLS